MTNAEKMLATLRRAKAEGSWLTRPDWLDEAIAEGEAACETEAAHPESSGPKQLTFANLRAANLARLPLFKNSKGGAAHSTKDGSDWSPAQWLQAALGELGEYATEREMFEQGFSTFGAYANAARKELADVATYLDILAARSFDFPSRVVPEADWTPAQHLQSLIGILGTYANARKKFERGDDSLEAYMSYAGLLFVRASDRLASLAAAATATPRAAWGDITNPHGTGVDLGAAVVEKWNIVSERVGCGLFMDDDGSLGAPPHG